MPKISELTEATSVSPTDELAIVQSGTTKRVDASKVVTYARTDAEAGSPATVIVDYSYPPGNVLRYGTNTVPGTTDMTAAISAAVDQAAVSGGTVTFPAGVYRITAAIPLKDGVRYVGEGMYSTRISVDYASGDGFANSTGARIVVSMADLEITTADTRTGTHGLNLGGVDRSTFERIRVWPETGSGFANGCTVDSTAFGSYHNTFIGCVFRGNSYGWQSIGNDANEGANSARLIGGELRADSGTACYVDRGNNLLISGVSFEGTSTYGIDVVGRAAGIAQVTIVGCRFEGVTNGIRLGQYSAGCLAVGNLYTSGLTTRVVSTGELNWWDDHIGQKVYFDKYDTIEIGRGNIRSVWDSGNAGQNALGTWQENDTYPRIAMRPNGRLVFGPGTGDVDAILRRSATATLQIESGTLDLNNKATIAGTISITSGTGSPEGAVSAPVGSLYVRSDGGTNTTLYVKESGSGNTGWVAK